MGIQLVNMPATSDLVDLRGHLTAGSIVANSDRTNFTGTLPIQKLRGSGTNIILYSEDTSNAAWVGGTVQTVAVAANTTYILSTNLEGATLTVAATTATISAGGSSTYGTSFAFTCTVAGNVTITTDTANPKAQLEALTSGQTIGPDLMDAGAGVFTSGTYGWTVYGTNTITNVGNALEVTYVDDAYGAQLALSSASDLSENLTVNSWYQIDLQSMVSSGGNVAVEVRDASETVLATYTETATSLTSRVLRFKATHATTNKLSFSGMGAGEVITIDNLTAKKIPDQSLLIPGPYAATAGSTATISAQVPYGPYGVVHEGESINYENYSCDMTQTSAWTATNITPLKDVTDPFEDANGATRLTAGANNGTILSTVTVDGIANNKIYWVWLKRITGTGAIYLTDDNSNWTEKTITSEWARYSLAARSQATPIVGIKMATSGDVIAASLNNVHKGTIVTSDIPTRGCPQIRRRTDYSWLMSTTLKEALGLLHTRFTYTFPLNF